MTASVQAADHREATRKDYSTYVAVTAIDIAGARAFNVGDPVPASTVDRPDSPIDPAAVAKVTTKAGQQAVENLES